LLDAHELLGHALIFEARRLQQEDKRACAAIHDGHFGRADVHMRIVDSEPGERGQQVLHGRNARRTINKSGTELGVAHVFRIGTDFGGRIEIGTSEDDTGVRCGRSQGHQDLLASVQAHTLRADGVLESALSEHLKLSPATVERCSGSATLSRKDSEASGSGRHTDTRIWRHRDPKKGALP
jgi:hypothetical protein